jgi:hypothetical protein
MTLEFSIVGDSVVVRLASDKSYWASDSTPLKALSKFLCMYSSNSFCKDFSEAEFFPETYESAE